MLYFILLFLLPFNQNFCKSLFFDVGNIETNYAGGLFKGKMKPMKKKPIHFSIMVHLEGNLNFQKKEEFFE